jgi:hypothetical protein
MKKEERTDENAEPGVENDRRMEVCDYAPEWAEHARLYDDNDPCEDGRAGLTVCGKREGEAPCPVKE